MRYISFFLFLCSCFLSTLNTTAQSSILLEAKKDNGIFSKRDSALDINNLPLSPIILPAIGVGTRLMWIPSKSAFRVGTILDYENGSMNNWNADSIGIYSIAGGLNVKATGTASTAFGSSTATGRFSTAIGLGKAEGPYSLAGGGNSISRGDFSFAMGYESNSAGEASIALGDGVTAYKYGGISLGAYNDPGHTVPNTYENPLSTDRIFQLGNGSFDFDGDNILSNALTVLRNGNMGIGNIAATLAPAERVVIDGNVSVLNAAKGIMLSGSSSPLLTKTSDVFTSGTYQNLGRWGLFKDTDNLTFGIPAITNKTFRFVSYNTNSTIAKTVLDINQNGNVSVDGFSKLGSSAPAIKVLKLTGTTAATQGTYTTIAHGLDFSKILSVEVFVSPSATVKHGRGWTAYGGYQFDFYLDTTLIQILNIAGNSSSILSKPYTVLITYEQ